MHTGVNPDDSHAFGATIADFRNECRKKPNAGIAYEVDADRFFDLLCNLLKGTERTHQEPRMSE